MSRFNIVVGCVLLGAVSAPAAEVWTSTFDAGPDGVVDLYNGNAGKAMIGAASGGSLSITTWDNSTGAYVPDKAGRALGSTVGNGSSFSGLYNFQWSTLNQVEPQACEIAGFLGTASPQTRQVLGAIMLHWKVGADYYINLGTIVGGSGDQVIDQSGGSTWLGTSAPDNDYKLAIGWDAATSTVQIGLYATDGTLIKSHSRQLAAPPPGVLDFQMTHLGWSDYTYNGGDRATVWSTDSLSFYDTASGAFDAAAVPEPASALLLIAGLIAMRRRV